MCSVHEVARAGRVDFLEGECSALVEHTLGLQALVLIIAVGGHAGAEGLEVSLAELVEDVLTRGAFVFTSETGTGQRRKWTY